MMSVYLTEAVKVELALALLVLKSSPCPLDSAM